MEVCKYSTLPLLYKTHAGNAVLTFVRKRKLHLYHGGITRNPDVV